MLPLRQIGSARAGIRAGLRFPRAEAIMVGRRLMTTGNVAVIIGGGAGSVLPFAAVSRRTAGAWWWPISTPPLRRKSIVANRRGTSVRPPQCDR